MQLDVRQGIHVLTLTNTRDGNENTLTTNVMNDYLAALDEVESFSAVRGRKGSNRTPKFPTTWHARCMMTSTLAESVF